MTIKIKDFTQVTTLLESTTTIEAGEHMPRIFFSRNNWIFIPKPRWSTNRTVQREGNFQHYNGSNDMTGAITLYLHGANRNSNLEIIKTIKEPIYLDCDDVNVNNSGLYTMTIRTYERNEDARLITIYLDLVAYNN